MEKRSADSTSRAIPDSPGLPEREGTTSALNPRSWTRRTWLIAGSVGLGVIIAAVAGGVLGARANAYPNYYKIDYTLQDTYAGDTFFDNFDYFTGYDPSHGFVHYVDSEGSVTQNLTSTSNTTRADSLASKGTAILRVDTSDENATTGRKSVRISSKKTYSSGLFIFDVLHSPYGCATWPALWLSDLETWPTGGEVDVMEAVNVGDTGNQMTLHTTGGCKIGKHRRRKETGTAISYDCHNTTNGNEGCGVKGPVSSYGEAFNGNGGGVYALEIRSEGIRVWMFGRDDIPSDISSNAPDPSQWGTALADFPNLECDIDLHFKNMSIVANIDLCGDWAGQQSLFSSNSMCTGTCSDWVATKASSFDQAYWEFGGFWVYEKA
ncbi:glycoside hydrolase family 16 protein [Lentithecium fluviatile CBS 122367]|uniref:endo-1,3(4)-beta-glucanase n=1 Tax=Lentithecium fluviatile CBS 122367 TaxID=1168545 RepID=A0A6G1IR98_9PLEO|nr:glycoside hydrolase family 16 protein [Lentithecium fluviatile CBS 122367]